MKQKSIGRLRVLVAVFALVGLGIMSYLTYIHYAEQSSFCDLSAEVSCDIVTSSLYSEIFGVPVSLLGLLYFALMLFLVATRPFAKTARLVFSLTLLMIIPSLYLSLMEVVEIKSFCILCESSKVMMLGILITTGLAMKEKTKKLARYSAPLVIAGVIFAGIIFFIQSGTTVKEDYSALIEHMNEQGWVYYKSYTCSNCKRQERMLGEAYSKLHAVECHPKGPGGQPELCLAKNITKTPTWLLEESGQELQRLEGLQSIEELEEASGFSN